MECCPALFLIGEKMKKTVLKISFLCFLLLGLFLLPWNKVSVAAATKYSISVNTAEHGTANAVTVSDTGAQVEVTEAEAGETVGIQMTPDSGYAIQNLQVKKENGENIQLKLNNGRYEFSMPATKIVVSPNFSTGHIFSICGADFVVVRKTGAIRVWNENGLELPATQTAQNSFKAKNTYIVPDGKCSYALYDVFLNQIERKEHYVEADTAVVLAKISLELDQGVGDRAVNCGMNVTLKDNNGEVLKPISWTDCMSGSNWNGYSGVTYVAEAENKTTLKFTCSVSPMDKRYTLDKSVFDIPVGTKTDAVRLGRGYSATRKIKITGGAEDTEAQFAIPKGAEAKMYFHNGSAYVEKPELPQSSYTVDTTSSDTYDIYTFKVISGKIAWIVCGGGDTPYTRTAIQLTCKQTEEPVVIDLKKKDEKSDVESWVFEDDLYTNIKENYLTMKVGDTHMLEGFRVQQTVDNVLGNNFIDPEMHYEVIAGDSVELEAAGGIGREYQTMKAVKKGISVIKITYDDFEEQQVTLGKASKNYILYSNPIDPVNTGIVIVNVGGSSGKIESGIKLTDFDTVYIPEKTILPDGSEVKGTTSVPYKFKPVNGDGAITAVKTHDPIQVNSNWNSGWTVHQPDEEGNYTIDLKEGRNIVCIESGDNVLYRIINAKNLTTTVTNVSRNGKIPQIGDMLDINFDGLELPVYKMCGIYNPGFPDQTWVEYQQNNGEKIESLHTQYNIENRNTISLQVDGEENIVLSSGQVHCVHLGSELYAHCKISMSGQAPNLSASAGKNSPYFDILPDITIPVVGKEVGVMDLIDAIDPSNNYLDSVEAIRTAKDAYELLTDEEKEKVTNVEKLNTAYAAVEDIIKVIEAIDALPETITLEQREAVEAANAAYTALTPERQKAVSNADKLQKAVETMQGLVTRQDRIDAVAARINALPEAAKLTKADAEVVAAARAAYDALTADEQDAVDTEKLTAAETQLSYIDAADSAMEAIAAIGEITLDNYETKYEQIVIARSAYDNLADGAKALVTNLDTLKKAEETYQSMDEDVKEVISAIGKLKEPLTKSNTEMSVDELKEIWDPYTYIVANIRGLADELTKEKQAIVTNINDLKTAEAYIQTIKESEKKDADQAVADEIAKNQLTEAVKLLEALPNKPAEGESVSAELIAQVAQAQALADMLSEEQKATVAKEKLDKLDELVKLTGSLEGYTDQYEATKKEVEKVAENAKNEAKVRQYVKELTEVYNTYKDKEVSRSDIAIIRQTIKAYDDLTDAQKDIIKNAEEASTITEMLDALKKQDEQVQKDEKAAAEVTEYIKNLPTSLNLDNMEAVRSDLQMIADKYNALNANAQSYVRMLSKVTATNNVLNTMTAEINTFRQGKPAVTAAATAYNSVTVSWNTYQYAQSYDVYRKTAGGEWTKLGNTTALQYVDQTAAGSTAYSYTVVALSSRWCQNVSSAYDENGAVVTTPAAPQPDNGNTTPDNGNTTPDNNNTPAVKDYTSLKAISAGVSSIKLSWKKVSKAGGYVVYRANSANGKYKAIKTIKKGKTTSFTDKKRTTGKTYYYKLRPYKTVKNKKQYMDYSSVVSTKAVPGRVKFTKLTAKNQKATLKWKKVSGASGYLLYRSDRRDGGFTCINSVSRRKTSYTNTKLKKGQTYYYRIRAYRKVGGKRVYGNFSVVKAVKAK